MEKEEKNEAKENETTEKKKILRKLPFKKIVIAVVVIVIIAVISIVAFIRLRTENVDNVEKALGKIELMNEDQIGGPVVGQKYRLKNEKGHSLGEVETGSDGKIMFYSVPVGEYSLEVVDKVEGYNSRVNEKKVTVYSGEKTIVNFVNDWQGGYLSVKVEDDANQPIENATIEVYDNEGYVYNKMMTDDKGKAGIIFEEYGTYYLKDVTETASRITDTTLYKVNVDEENKTFNKTLTQERCKGNILLVVTDQNQLPVNEIKYEVLDDSKEQVSVMTTNEKGLAGIKNVPLGTYYVRRMNSETDTEMIECKIEENEQIVRKDISITK